ncbi:MAG TPA: hypothetical protein VN541_08585 [Tepidisphaeraceae bacterium]|nr:hypothetical protein [Tepidisphaeraceae bacterium]
MAKQYFRIDGADSTSGQETYLVLRAESKPHAERLARKQGILVSSVRIAKPTDWESADTTTDVAEPAPAPGDGDISSEPAPDIPAREPALRPMDPAPAIPTPSQMSEPTGSSAAAILLSFIGAALVLGGVLALSLALWPDDTVRNELQQVDFRLHELSQTILGSMLVLGGLLIFVLAAVLVSTRSRRGR